MSEDYATDWNLNFLIKTVGDLVLERPIPIGRRAGWVARGLVADISENFPYIFRNDIVQSPKKISI